MSCRFKLLIFFFSFASLCAGAGGAYEFGEDPLLEDEFHEYLSPDDEDCCWFLDDDDDEDDSFFYDGYYDDDFLYNDEYSFCDDEDWSYFIDDHREEDREDDDGYDDDDEGSFFCDGYDDEDDWFFAIDEEECRSLHSDDPPIPEFPLVEAIPGTLVAGCVNAFSGDFVETVCDITVPGPVPLTIQRSWTSGERKWHFGHMPKLQVGFSKKGNHVEAGYQDDLGSGYHFKGAVKFGSCDLSDISKGLKISSKSFRKGLTNIGSSEISGQTSWKGVSIRALHKKDKRRLILRHGTHVDRLFKRYYSRGTEHSVRCGKFRLEEETHPSGSSLLYRYNSHNDLTEIFAKDKHQKTQHTVAIQDVKKTRSQIWTTAAGSLCYYFAPDRETLTRVTSSQHAPIAYIYDKRKRIKEKILPNGRILHIEYIDHGDNKDKVKRLKLSAGPEGKLETTHTFTYYGDEKNGHATVVDAGGGITHYIRKNRRLDRICHPSGLVELFTWNDEGELVKRALIHEGAVILDKSITYDLAGNILESTTAGDLKGDGTCSFHTKTFKSTQDSWHLPLEETDGEITLRFEYAPASNLLTKRLTFTSGLLVKREFFAYDDNGCVSLEILDDGTSENPDDLTGISERHVKKITSTQGFPFGLPEKVEEFALDLKSGSLIPVSNVTSRYSPQGKKLEESHFDSEGNLAYTLFWEYDAFGNLTLERNALGETILYSYDDNQNKVLEQHAAYTKHFVWDFANRLIQEKEVWNDGRTFVQNHQYDPLCRKIRSIGIYGDATDYTYDTSGRLIETVRSQIHGTRPTEKAEFNALGYKSCITDPQGFKTFTRYTCRGQPAEVLHPDGTSEIREYDIQGRLVKEVSKEGVATSYERDSFGRVIKKSVYDREGRLAKTATRRYSTFQLLEETDEEGVTTHYSYDAAGRKISEERESLKTEYVYDSLGRAVKKIERLSKELARVTRFSYDLLGRVTEEVIEELSGEVFQKSALAYDSLGNKTERTLGNSTVKILYNPKAKPVLKKDPLGFETRYLYEYNYPFEGRAVLKVTRIDPLGNQEITLLDHEERVLRKSYQDFVGNTLKEETNTYDLSGRLLKTVTLKGLETCWEYDSMGREIACREASGLLEEKITRHFYNSLGQRSATLKPDGVKLLFSYDALGRLEQENSSDGALHVFYTYDVKDRIITAKNHLTGQETRRFYDHHGNLIAETLENGLRSSYSYDALNRLNEITLPDGSKVRYQRSGCRLLSVERVLSGEVAYSHRYISRDLSGFSLKEELPLNLGYSSRGYDSCGRLLSFQAPFYREMLTYDSVGNPIRRETEAAGNTFINAFSYDALNRLTEETGEFTRKYRYDFSDNRIGKNADPSSVNALNQTLEEEGACYRYDPNGNMVQKQDHIGTTTYRYDPLNRLIAIESSSSNAIYSYDAFHRRIKKTLNGVSEDYLYLQDSEIGACKNGSLRELRILGEGIREEIGASIAFEIEGETLIPLHNSSGSVASLLDKEGNSIAYRMTAFGEGSIGDARQPWIFSSKRSDPETGFYYFGRRYYSPSLGRFITPDPAGFEDGLNLYSYVHSNPLVHVDPDGQLAFLIPIAINIGISYAMEMALPYAVAALEACGATTAASFVSGTVHGFTGNFEWSAFGTDSKLSYIEQAGLAIGFTRSYISGKNVNGAIQSIASREMAGNVAAQVTPKAKSVTTWFTKSSARQAAHETTATTVQKTTKAASEGLLSKNSAIPVKSQAVSVEEKLCTRFVAMPDGKIVDLKPTLDRIAAGGTFPHVRDGSTFLNREGLLPARPFGYYREFVNPTPGLRVPGPQRIVKGQEGEQWLTTDHYKTFIPIR